MMLALLLAAAEAATPGSASAQGLDLKGGMSLIDGSMITAIFTGMAAVIGAIGGVFWKVHRDKVKAEIPQPCEVHRQVDCISVQECNRRMRELDERVTRIEQKFDSGFDRIMDKLGAMDRDGEQRAIGLHRRFDGIVEKVAHPDGEVGLIKAKMFKGRG